MDEADQDKDGKYGHGLGKTLILYSIVLRYLSKVHLKNIKISAIQLRLFWSSAQKWQRE